MANDSSSFTPDARLDALNNELTAINSLIIRESIKLREKPELVKQLIARCDELCHELKAIQSAYRNGNGNSVSGAENLGAEFGLKAKSPDTFLN